ncbi:unnamed protein product [Bemisia tabaci]|uniref:Macro domain-containing protein n=1 Tax=Bemisia tabaci TaxID=7038 RepID=A0A9P0EWP6_BEMTA|nr:unnamed protein product [Bemisia tabaci]
MIAILSLACPRFVPKLSFLGSSSVFIQQLNMSFAVEKEKFMKMSAEEKRTLTKSKKVSLADIDTWDVYLSKNSDQLRNQLDARLKQGSLDVEEFTVDPDLAKRVSIFDGDITGLFVDAIVNAANSRLLGGGGVDGAIHRAAGPSLLEECKTLKGCPTGDAKITGGYKLPAKYVIHTVGPQDGSDMDLRSCYEKSLQLCIEHDIHSVAFPCISTGVYGFPHERASIIATTTVRKFLQDNPSIERVIFCVFQEVDVKIYQNILQKVFPVN